MSDGNPCQVEHWKWLRGTTMLWLAFLVFMLLGSFLGAKGSPKVIGEKAKRAVTGETAQETPAKSPDATWKLAVSGDSRNCGDVIMPAIAAGTLAHGAAFYWHLGDFRRGSDFDEDMTNEATYPKHPMSISWCETNNWNDFIQNQLLPYGKVPVFLTIGNHELKFKTEQDYLVEFANWLITPMIRNQRIDDNPTGFRLCTYYHWTFGTIDFISLDKASTYQFADKQVQWFESVLKRDESDSQVHTIVVGMHRPLPHSLADHDMDKSAMGAESGTRVYEDLLTADREMHKRVYILGGHAHFYMANVFNTNYWRSHGGVLPGWIIGTAGATRDDLPNDSVEASEAMMGVYGYLLGTVNPSGNHGGTISFKYYQVKKSDVPLAVVDKFSADLDNWCFEGNYSGGKPISSEN